MLYSRFYHKYSFYFSKKDTCQMNYIILCLTTCIPTFIFKFSAVFTCYCQNFEKISHPIITTVRDTHTTSGYRLNLLKWKLQQPKYLLLLRSHHRTTYHPLYVHLPYILSFCLSLHSPHRNTSV